MVGLRIEKKMFPLSADNRTVHVEHLRKSDKQLELIRV